MNVGSWEEFTYFADRKSYAWNNLIGQRKDHPYLGVVTPQQYGGAVNGTTNDASALSSAESAASFVYISGDTKVSTAAASLNGVFFGQGQIIDVAGNKRGKYFSAIKAAPSSLGNEAGGVDTAFNGDWSKGQFPVEHRITGVSTLSLPTTGYTYTPEAYPHYTFLYNESGWNNTTSTNVGRTAAVGYRTKVYQNGQGDAVAYNASVFVTGAKVSSTSFLANPAGVIVNGDMTAGQDGVYLNAGEFVLDDQAVYDCAGIGWVVNLDRSVSTGAKGVWWSGYRAQSIGTQPIDTGFSLTGKANFGLDFSFADFGANKAGITFSADQRFYGNATATDATGLQRYPSAVGDAYFTYASGLSAWNFIVGGGSAMQVYGTKIVSASGWVMIKDGNTAPAAEVGYAQIYVDTADGDLKVIFGDGVVKTISVDT